MRQQRVARADGRRRGESKFDTARISDYWSGRELQICVTLLTGAVTPRALDGSLPETAVVHGQPPENCG